MKASFRLPLITLLIGYLLLQSFEVKKHILAKPGESAATGILTEKGLPSHTVAGANTGTTVRVSVASNGVQGNLPAMEAAISADGRDIAFVSEADNLVSGDTNGQADIFVHDRVSGKTNRASVASDGTQGNQRSFAPSISDEGRYVSFSSYASNLVSGDTNDSGDVFVHDRVTGQTTRVSVASDGTQGNNQSFSSSISADGRYVAFESEASNLVSGDTNDARDVFVHDRVTRRTTRASLASDGTQANGQSFGERFSISAYGRYVTFTSEASNLVSGDTNNLYDVFVHDRETGQTTRPSVASDGTPGNLASYGPSISRDGRYVAFGSEADNLVSGDLNGRGDVFVHDRVTGQTDRVSLASDGTEANHLSSEASISAAGRYVAFFSSASNLVSDDTNGAWDVFVHDRQTGETTRVSVAFGGSQGNAESRRPSISADGRFVAFASNASNLVSDDTNGTWDVFVHDLLGAVFGYLPMIFNAYSSPPSAAPEPQATLTATSSPIPTYMPDPTGTATATPADILTPTATPDVTPTETVQPTFTHTPTRTSTPPPVALGHESWTETTTPTELPPRLAPGQPATISYIDMIDAFSGWAIGGRQDRWGHILRTRDGGQTWRDVTPPDTTSVRANYYKFALGLFLDSEKAWVTFYSDHPQNVVWRTLDGGQTWSHGQPVPNDSFERYTPRFLHFVDDNYGWLLLVGDVGGSDVSMFATTDGGETWVKRFDPNISGLDDCLITGMLFADDQHGWLTRWLPPDCSGLVAGGVMLEQTNDGGRTWEVRKLPPPEDMPDLHEQPTSCSHYSLNLISPRSVSFVLTCLSNDPTQFRRFFYSTMDGGKTWFTSPFPGGSLLMLNRNFGWALSRDIYQTTDGGLTWEHLKTVNWDGQFDFVDENTGFAVAYVASRSVNQIALVRTFDGGRSWVQISPVIAGSDG